MGAWRHGSKETRRLGHLRSTALAKEGAPLSSSPVSSFRSFTMIVLSSIEQRHFNKSLACLLIILLSVLLYLRAGIAERGAGAGANSYTAAYESFLDDLVGTNSFQVGLRTVSSRGNEQNHMQTTPSTVVVTASL